MFKNNKLSKSEKINLYNEIKNNMIDCLYRYGDISGLINLKQNKKETELVFDFMGNITEVKRTNYAPRFNGNVNINTNENSNSTNTFEEPWDAYGMVVRGGIINDKGDFVPNYGRSSYDDSSIGSYGSIYDID